MTCIDIDIDREILRWINGFGIATAIQIQKQFRLSFKEAQMCCQRLIERELISAVDTVTTLPIYRVTNSGRCRSKDDLPDISHDPNTINWVLFVIDISIELELDFDGTFRPQRRLIHEEQPPHGRLSWFDEEQQENDIWFCPHQRYLPPIVADNFVNRRRVFYATDDVARRIRAGNSQYDVHEVPFTPTI